MSAVSCCVAIKDRCVIPHDGKSIVLFPKTVDSVLAAAGNLDEFELVVCDFGSTDMPLAEWLPDRVRAAGRVLTLIDMSGERFFCKGRGLNLAVSEAAHDTIMFMDTEMLIPGTFMDHGIATVDSGGAYFPICEYSRNAANNSFSWSNGGKGNSMLHRDVVIRAHGIPEYEHWGYEDTRFFEIVSALVPVVREQLPGFRHMWHPNTPDWKNRHYAAGAANAVTRSRMRNSSHKRGERL